MAEEIADHGLTGTEAEILRMVVRRVRALESGKPGQEDDRNPRPDRKFFGRPVISSSDDTPTQHNQNNPGWFETVHGPAHPDADTATGSGRDAYPLKTCPAGVTCLIERIAGYWYAAPLDCAPPEV